MREADLQACSLVSLGHTADPMDWSGAPGAERPVSCGSVESHCNTERGLTSVKFLWNHASYGK